MSKPPQHRADAPIIFIWSRDPAWDVDRFVEEIKQLPEEDKGDHIVSAHFGGRTRGDLNAPGPDGATVEDYLDGTETRVELKRLRAVDVAALRDRGGQSASLQAASLAHEKVDDLFDRYGLKFVIELGEFAMRCAEAPRPGEFKRSGS